MSFLGLGSSDPIGYSGLTPDQSSMLGQQGWYPRPDMVLPTGSTLQQPPGYSNLTPAQAATVNSLGYYTNSDATKPDSLLKQIIDKMGSSKGQEAIKKLQDAMSPQQQQQAQAQVAPPMHLPAGLNPLYNIFNARQRSPLDPQQALQRLIQGY